MNAAGWAPEQGQDCPTSFNRIFYTLYDLQNCKQKQMLNAVEPPLSGHPLSGHPPLLRWPVFKVPKDLSVQYCK